MLKKMSNWASNKRFAYLRGKQAGYRSGLEEDIAKQIKQETGEDAKYEQSVIEYIDPTTHKYHPDFVLPNGIIIETKGYFLSKDRTKHLWIKKQYPNIDLRFVFNNSKAKLNKNSKTSYGDWCDKHGFKYADKTIPLTWFKEVRISLI